MGLGVLFAAAMLATASQSPPSQSLPPPAADEVEAVVVTGVRTEAIREFLTEVAAPTSKGQLARWSQDVCPRTIGFNNPDVNAYFNSTLIQTARGVGLREDRGRCTTNILVLVTNEPDRVAQTLVEEHRRLMDARRDRGRGLSAGGEQSLETFTTTDDPVRWWHVAQTVGVDGMPVDGETRAGGSRLRGSVIQRFTFVVMIVDAGQMKGLKQKTVAAYVSMAALAQFNPEAQPNGVRSILTLFADRKAGRPAPTTLTRWDRSYLRALYAAPRTDSNLAAQLRSIERRMATAGEEAAPEADAP